MDIVRIRGGLGNQMFDYALVEALRSRGREVSCSLGYYRRHPQVMPFQLDKIFNNVDLAEIGDDIFDEIDRKWKIIKSNAFELNKFKTNLQERFFYVEEEDCVYHANVFDTQNCTFVGCWQTEKYFSNIRDRILEAFRFDIKEEKIERLGEKLKENYISVHIRRGDYVNHPLFEGICTMDYYYRAMEYMKNKVPDGKFVFFTNDIEWVKKNFPCDKLLIPQDLIAEYEDWYDMYLMSCCNHNIIANSTFSWWGAWLNEYQGKIVIAPQKWMNGKNTPDICPDNWIRI